MTGESPRRKWSRQGALALARARVLVCNDDGIHAPGLKALERVARKLAREVWVVAPEEEQSAASHSLTIRRPLRLRELSPRRYAVDGTPTDCVMLAVHKIMLEGPPDLVLSGFNRGANMGEDVIYSGTVAAAMEAAILGLRAVALSQTIENGKPVRWATAERWAPQVLKRLASASWPAGVFVNVNFPDEPARAVAGVEATRLGRRKLGDEIVEGRDPRGVPFFWIGGQRAEERHRRGTDLEAVARGAISVTPLHLDRTHGASLRSLRRLFP
jgi:5'-nucleotidase